MILKTKVINYFKYSHSRINPKSCGAKYGIKKISFLYLGESKFQTRLNPL